MTGPVVTLTSAEWALANQVAALRQVSNEAVARRDAHGASVELGLDLHLQGAAAEAAVAKWRNVWWSGALNQLKAADVGSLQVRSTQHENGCLIVHPSDPDDDVFILAVGKAPTFRLAGWIRGSAAKDQGFWRDPTGKGRAAYFVPQSALRPMERGQGARGASPQMERAPAAANG